VKILKENYQVLMNGKYKKIIGPITDIIGADFEKRQEKTDIAIQKFKNNLKLFSKYYYFYEQSDNILSKYEESNKLSQALEEDYEKIKKQIDNLNKIGLKDIFITVKEQAEKEAAQNDSNNYELNDINNGNENLIRKSTLIVQEALNRDEFYKKREEELQEIHIISKQIKDTTQNMALKVNEQGEQLNNIEDNVNKALDNVEKAHEEIKVADKMSNKNKKKMWCFICIVTVSILAISAIILSLIFGNNN
jgi:tetratricopeptide (TPR) repeat protein